MSARIRTQPQLLPDDAVTDIVRMNSADSIHKAAFGQQFCEIIQHEANAFGAPFNNKSFSKVIDAVSAGKAQAYFLLAGTETSHPYFIGASIQFMSVITKWNGQDFEHYQAPYFEDICVSSQRLANFMRVAGAGFSKGASLGTHFMQEMVRSSVSNTYGDTPAGVSGKGFVGEYAPDGKQIIRILNKFNPTLGQEGTSAILELEDFAPSSAMELEVQKLSSVSNSKTIINHDNIFVVGWSDQTAQQRVVASFTEAISSFTGESILRVQFTTSGFLPTKDVLTDVIKSILTEGQTEASSRGWASDVDIDDFMKMRIHIMNEPEIIASLKTVGAAERILGGRPMLPFITDFANTPPDMLSGVAFNAQPLVGEPIEAEQGNDGRLVKKYVALVA